MAKPQGKDKGRVLPVGAIRQIAADQILSKKGPVDKLFTPGQISDASYQQGIREGKDLMGKALLDHFHTRYKELERIDTDEGKAILNVVREAAQFIRDNS